MTGLETILSTIAADAREAARHTLDEAQKEADRLLEEARLEGNRRAEALNAAGKSEAAALLERADSAAQLSRRKALLTAKQQIIGSVIDSAKEQLKHLPDEEYFETLLKLACKYSAESAVAGGIMKLSGADLARLPASFEAELQRRTGRAIRVSPEAAPIENGFLLVCGEIDINCTFDALFEDRAESLQDQVNAILFA